MSTGKGPIARVCYICGRQYGLSSYDIHLKQCKELWIAREEKNPPKDRRPLPEDPFVNFTGSSKGTNNEANLEELNKIAQEQFKTAALVACQYCNRTFLPEKLLIHNRSCTVDTPAKKVEKLATPHATPERPKTTQQGSNSRTPLSATTPIPKTATSTSSKKPPPSATDDGGISYREPPPAYDASIGSNTDAPAKSPTSRPRRQSAAKASIETDSSLPINNTINTNNTMTISPAIYQKLQTKLNETERKITEFTHLITTLSQDVMEMKGLLGQLVVGTSENRGDK